jgi:hypothetical protein
MHRRSMPSNYDTRNPRGRQRNKLSREAYIAVDAYPQLNSCQGEKALVGAGDQAP